MSDNENTFTDFVTDKDGDYSKAEFQSLARKLLEQGRDPGRVFLAMYRAAAQESITHSIAEHYGFIKTVHDEVNDYMATLDAQMDRLIEKQQLQ